MNELEAPVLKCIHYMESYKILLNKLVCIINLVYYHNVYALTVRIGATSYKALRHQTTSGFNCIG